MGSGTIWKAPTIFCRLAGRSDTFCWLHTVKHCGGGGGEAPRAAARLAWVGGALRCELAWTCIRGMWPLPRRASRHAHPTCSLPRRMLLMRLLGAAARLLQAALRVEGAVPNMAPRSNAPGTSTVLTRACCAVTTGAIGRSWHRRSDCRVLPRSRAKPGERADVGRSPVWFLSGALAPAWSRHLPDFCHAVIADRGDR